MACLGGMQPQRPQDPGAYSPGARTARVAHPPQTTPGGFLEHAVAMGSRPSRSQASRKPSMSVRERSFPQAEHALGIR